MENQVLIISTALAKKFVKAENLLTLEWEELIDITETLFIVNFNMKCFKVIN